MSEHESENQLEAFKANFEQGLQDLLDSAEVMLDVPRPPDPNSMGFDERTMEELTPAEKEVVKLVICQKLGLDPDKLEEAKIREYTTRVEQRIYESGLLVPATQIHVSVYKTNREQGGIFLQELNFPDGEKRWVIGPDQNI